MLVCWLPVLIIILSLAKHQHASAACVAGGAGPAAVGAGFGPAVDCGAFPLHGI
jgi:hypothetical protein